VSRLTPDNTVVNAGVLQVAHSIFKRWRPLFQSDALYTEINFVLQRFGPAFLSVFDSTNQQIDQNKDNKQALTALFSTLNLIIKLFYDLSSQDLPPVFEDNLQTIMSLLHKYLTYTNPLLDTDDEGESGPLEYVKAGICEAIILYGQKYLDAFTPSVPLFTESTWNLLTTIGAETKYDVVVSKALQYLTVVTKIPESAASFNNEEILKQIVEKVVLPNLALRTSDEELFEDEPIEFIRRDLEGADSDTRRRASTDFLRALLTQFDELVTGVVMVYVNLHLQDYEKDQSSNWKSKDTAVYLFTSIAATGVVTAGQGVKTVNPRVSIMEFFQKYIASDLVASDIAHPILRVDAIKYLYNFRSQLSKQQWHDAFPLLVRHLGDSNYVVYTYAAIVVERVLTMTENNEPYFSQQDVQPLASELLNHLFGLIEAGQAPEKVQENEFLMRCVMRVLTVIKEGVVGIVENVVAHLIKITEIISKNPSNPRFYYYHFEALGAVIRYASPTASSKIDKPLFVPFTAILQHEVQGTLPRNWEIVLNLY
jgi:exportin-2 (importin alpha re-exporter)